MKFPSQIENVQVIPRSYFQMFPPSGFLELADGNDGAGDSYGLYWELGKEDQEPVVCYQSHEESSLVPQFQNLSAFIDWFSETDGNEGPSINLNDTTFFMNLFLKGKILSKNGKVKEAIEKLEASVFLFSEYSEAWALLAENYYKLNDKTNGDRASINSIVSNYIFGVPSQKAIDLFNKIEVTEDLRQNSLIAYKKDFISGGDYTNPFRIDYSKMKDIIKDFIDKGEFEQAVLMNQNFGYLMYLETKEVREKYHFDISDWTNNFLSDLTTYFPERKF